VNHFDTQMDLFSDAFHLPNNKKIITCFTDNHKGESSHNFDNNPDVSLAGAQKQDDDFNCCVIL